MQADKNHPSVFPEQLHWDHERPSDLLGRGTCDLSDKPSGLLEAERRSLNL